MNRALSAMTGTVTVLVVLAGCGTPLAGRYNDDSVPYRPSTAMVASSSDCLSTNIYTALTGLGPWDSALTPDAPQPGFPPSDFRPVAVLKCERGVDGDGFLTVDSVRLEGDVASCTDPLRFTLPKPRSSGHRPGCRTKTVPAIHAAMTDVTRPLPRPPSSR